MWIVLQILLLVSKYRKFSIQLRHFTNPQSLTFHWGLFILSPADFLFPSRFSDWPGKTDSRFFQRKPEKNRHRRRINRKSQLFNFGWAIYRSWPLFSNSLETVFERFAGKSSHHHVDFKSRFESYYRCLQPNCNLGKRDNRKRSPNQCRYSTGVGKLFCGVKANSMLKPHLYLI